MNKSNKLGIAPVVITSLLLFTVVVSSIVFNNWYGSFTSGFESKKIYQHKLSQNELDLFRFINNSNDYSLYIRKFNSNYIIIDNISVNNINCTMNEYNNVIVGNDITTIKLSCNNVKNKNDITLFSKSGIYHQKVLLQ